MLWLKCFPKMNLNWLAVEQQRSPSTIPLSEHSTCHVSSEMTCILSALLDIYKLPSAFSAINKIPRLHFLPLSQLSLPHTVSCLIPPSPLPVLAPSITPFSVGSVSREEIYSPQTRPLCPRMPACACFLHVEWITQLRIRMCLYATSKQGGGIMVTYWCLYLKCWGHSLKPRVAQRVKLSHKTNWSVCLVNRVHLGWRESCQSNPKLELLKIIPLRFAEILNGIPFRKSLIMTFSNVMLFSVT